MQIAGCQWFTQKLGQWGPQLSMGPHMGHRQKRWQSQVIICHNQLAPTKTGLMMKRSINFWRSSAGAPHFFWTHTVTFPRLPPGQATPRFAASRGTSLPDVRTAPPWPRSLGPRQKKGWVSRMVVLQPFFFSCKVGEKSSTLIGFLEYVCCA